ncbi:phenolic glucoside malonyltransferase 1-like [Macadamia integrifolia]|uniref:phenolic glucoside malonyltransferase 1-like n=1 Tax=Macadamia integrifolia TaxID=60698 RepID=UPI001C500528|nr:phenolic glucoside malonyltransferase 1-like [Macadamia integrifolia]
MNILTLHTTSKTIYLNLKHSLSLTLQYFYPLAGHLVWPQNLSEPEFCYVDGDSVSLTLAESDGDFYHLSGNHARDVNQFHFLVPKLTLPSMVDLDFSISLLALQVTVFPNSGICIGVTASHVALDARTLVHFMKSWATISRSGVVSLSPDSGLPGSSSSRNIFWKLHDRAEYFISSRSAAKEPFAVAGSPKYRIYDTDFGWGRPKKYESLRVGGKFVSLYDCKDGEGSLEVGVAFPKLQLDSFSSLFYRFQANVA